MSLINAPYGLQPVKRLDGLPYAGAVTEFDINPAGYAANIFNGSIVFTNTSGFLEIATATGADGTTNALPTGSTLTGVAGVFVGCEYVNQQGQLINSQFYPANTVAQTGSRIKAYVVTDPDVLFKAQLNGPATQAMIGANTFLAAVQSTSTGNTRTGNSTSALSTSVQTGSAAFRIVELAAPTTDAFGEVLVKFNPGYHALTNAVGL